MVDFVTLTLVIAAGWIAASVIGTQAYFQGEQSKAIQEGN